MSGIQNERLVLKGTISLHNAEEAFAVCGQEEHHFLPSFCGHNTSNFKHTAFLVFWDRGFCAKIGYLSF